MASLPSLPSKTQQEEEEDEQSDLVSTLPANDRWAPIRDLQGFWLPKGWLAGTLATREHFVARSSDIFLASFPKSGTTWLKSMVLSLVHRSAHPSHDGGHPLQHANPHDLVNYLEILYFLQKNPDLTSLPSPRILATHNAYSNLPESIKTCGSRIIYVAREPKDNFVSTWHFIQVVKPEGMTGISIDEAFDMFCSWIWPWGPIWEHALVYWSEHLRHPDKVLFLKYEAMKEDPVESLKRLAVFLGCPFSSEEEEQGVPESIAELCSFRNLSNLEVNKDGALGWKPYTPNKTFFRRGEVGDWANT